MYVTIILVVILFFKVLFVQLLCHFLAIALVLCLVFEIEASVINKYASSRLILLTLDEINSCNNRLKMSIPCFLYLTFLTCCLIDNTTSDSM